LLKENILKNSNAAEKQLQLFAATSHPEELHQLRVHLKRIRAMLRLLLEVHPKNKQLKKERKKLRVFFAEGGDIRQLQLMNAWLVKNKFLLLEKEAASLKQLPVFIELFVHKSSANSKLLKSLKNKMIDVAEEVNDKTILEYAAMIKESLEAAMKDRKTADWHELRKNIKQLLYVYNLLPASKKLKLLTVNEVKKMDALQQQIGAWHDLLDFKTWLSKEGFYMSADKQVHTQFVKAWNLLEKQLQASEKKLTPVFKNAGVRKK